MASAVATDFTNQIEYTDEIADFSPEVVAEMKIAFDEISAGQKAFGVDSAAFRCSARTRLR